MPWGVDPCGLLLSSSHIHCLLSGCGPSEVRNWRTGGSQNVSSLSLPPAPTFRPTLLPASRGKPWTPELQGSISSLHPIITFVIYMRASCTVAQLVKNLPAMQDTWVQFLGWGDPLEKGKTTESSILSWRIPWTV